MRRPLARSAAPSLGTGVERLAGRGIRQARQRGGVAHVHVHSKQFLCKMTLEAQSAARMEGRLDQGQAPTREGDQEWRW